METKLKGRKIYGVSRGEKDSGIITYRDKETAIEGLDSKYPFLVELEVVRVFTRERDLVEIEKDEPKNP